MTTDIQILRELPLKELISAPLNAVIEAQADAAMTTVAFIESIGMITDSGNTSLLDQDDPTDQTNYKIRMARFSIKKTTDASETATDVEMPYITLFDPPAFEINSLEWDFNVRLKSITSFSAALGVSASMNSSLTTEGQINLKKRVKVASTMKVETSLKTDFEMRYKADREQEYNLHIKINANKAPLSKGISKLLDIVEAVAAKEETSATQ